MDVSLSTTQLVAQQYEVYPYPLRDPADEARRLLRPSLDELAAINHYGYCGRQSFRNGFRALVAGGGTGDATVYLAHQLAPLGGKVVHLDLSRQSIEIARSRARARQLDHAIRWVQGSLLDLPRLDLGTFDYVDCSGVLHHLDSPAEGLASLKTVLKDDGVLGLMLYARFGRTGIYPAQDLLRLLIPQNSSPEEKVALAREVLSGLPPTNWMNRGREFRKKLDRSDDNEVYDKFLHAQDRPYTVGEIYQLLDGAGLHLAEVARDNRILYQPCFGGQMPKLAGTIASLGPREQRMAAELYWGAISKHMFWATRRSDTVADPRQPDNVPFFSQFDLLRFDVRQVLLGSAGSTWKLNLRCEEEATVTVALRMDPVTCRLVELIDGRRTIGQMIDVVTAELTELTQESAWAAWLTLFSTLRTCDYVLLRHQSVPPLG